MRQKMVQVLPQEEYFSYVKGGALSTWVKETMSWNKDWDLIVATPRCSTHYKGFTMLRIPVRMFYPLRKVLTGKAKHHVMYNLYPVLIALYCRLFKVGIAHIHNRPTYTIFIKYLSPATRVVLHMHNDHLLFMEQQMAERCLGKTDKLISVSHYIANGIKNLPVKFNGSHQVLYNGANQEVFRHVGQVSSSNDILFVGRIDPTKGVAELIRAALQVKEKLPDIRLHVVGGAWFGDNSTSEYTKEIEQLVRSAPETIILHGYKKQSELFPIFERCAIYVIPSIWDDPSPLSVLEGMAVGLPMIVSNRGGIPEEVGDTALSIDCSDIDLLATKIEFLLTNRSLGLELSAKAYKRYLERFTWQHVYNNLKVILSEN